MTDITSTLPGPAAEVTARRRGVAAKSYHAPSSARNASEHPLVVDLDGTLIRSDLLVESGFAHLGQNPLRIFGLLEALFRGKAALKAHIAAATGIDVTGLPYDQEVLALIHDARGRGRAVYLVSASNERYVSAVATHLGLFDGWFASSSSENLSSTAKAKLLVAVFGSGGFDYVGNDEADLAVWEVARTRLAIRTSAAVRAKLTALAPDATFLKHSHGTIRAWVKLLRIHQWAKNALVLVPLLTAQQFDLLSLGKALSAAFCFSLAASSIYILNDLVDIGPDRAHPTKRNRPLAAGTVSVLDALAAIPLLLAASLVGGFFITPWFAAVLIIYLALTTSYTFVLKRKMMVDVVALASLYTIRVIGGAVAISVPVSEWLLAFSLFIFAALALTKRYVELAALQDADLPSPANRNYLTSDLYIVAMLATAAAFNAITVFALYISSDAVKALYQHPQILWLVCPILMYWLGRIIMLAHRRLMNDDPVLFALRDWNSLVAAGLIGAVLVAAM
jgi:4-hydroxybenzoate polyprenyltransferase/phosphoserine phosphatase